MKRLFVFGVLVLLGFHFFSCKKNGHTSPDSGDLVDSTLMLIHTFPDFINESSGLQFFNNTLWTHNDSSNEPVLFEIDASNIIFIRPVVVEGAENIDWEDLALDAENLYIGDFGNNFGNRKDLKVYRISRTDLSKDTISNFGLIEFSFSDQQQFDYDLRMHDFDCEAMIAFNDELMLFSKNHINGKCRLYSLPKNAGTFEAVLLDSFDTMGTITGAAIDSGNALLALSGYTYDEIADDYLPFIWLFSNFSSNQIFHGDSKKINLAISEKVEGITSIEDGQFLISSESRSGNPGKVYLFDAKKWLE